MNVKEIFDAIIYGMIFLWILSAIFSFLDNPPRKKIVESKYRCAYCRWPMKHHSMLEGAEFEKYKKLNGKSKWWCTYCLSDVIDG